MPEAGSPGGPVGVRPALSPGREAGPLGAGRVGSVSAPRSQAHDPGGAGPEPVPGPGGGTGALPPGPAGRRCFRAAATRGRARLSHAGPAGLPAGRLAGRRATAPAGPCAVAAPGPPRPGGPGELAGASDRPDFPPALPRPRRPGLMGAAGWAPQARAMAARSGPLAHRRPPTSSAVSPGRVEKR